MTTTTNHQALIVHCSDNSAHHDAVSNFIQLEIIKTKIRTDGDEITLDKVKELQDMVNAVYIHKERSFVVETAPEVNQTVLDAFYYTAIHQYIVIKSKKGVTYSLKFGPMTFTVNASLEYKDTIYKAKLELKGGSPEASVAGGNAERYLEKIKEWVGYLAEDCNLKITRCNRALTDTGRIVPTCIYMDFDIKDRERVDGALTLLDRRDPWPKLINIKMPQTDSIITLNFLEVETEHGKANPIHGWLGICWKCGLDYKFMYKCKCAVAKKRKAPGSGASSRDDALRGALLL